MHRQCYCDASLKKVYTNFRNVKYSFENTFDNEEYTDNRQQTNVLVLGNNSPNPSGLLISHLPKSRVFLSALIYMNPWPNRQSICGMTISPSSESTLFGTFVTSCSDQSENAYLTETLLQYSCSHGKVVKSDRMDSFGLNIDIGKSSPY